MWSHVNILHFLCFNISNALRMQTHDIFESRPQDIQKGLIIAVQYSTTAFVDDQLKTIDYVYTQKDGNRIVTCAYMGFQVFLNFIEVFLKSFNIILNGIE